MTLPFNFSRSLFKSTYLFVLLASLAISSNSEPVSQDSPLMVYAERALRVDDLKRRYGEKLVTSSAANNWTVKKELYIATGYDFFAYRENSRGELIEMTGYVSGACDKVLKNYFEALMPIHVSERGRPLPAKVSISGIKIDIASDGVPSHFGGQTISLEYDKDRSSQACYMSHTFRRKTD